MKLYVRNVGERMGEVARDVSAGIGTTMVNSNPNAKCSAATVNPIMDGGAYVYKQTNKTKRKGPKWPDTTENPHTHTKHIGSWH